MDTFRNHRKIWTVVMVIVTLALLATSFLPYLALM